MLLSMLLILTVSLNLSAINPTYAINSDKLYTEGYVTIKWGTFYESWTPDIAIEHSFDNNYIEVSKLDDTEKSVIVRFCRKGDDVYHRYWMKTYNGVLAQNCQDMKTLHADHVSTIGDQVDAHIGSDSWAFTRVYIPAKYINSGFKIHINCKYRRYSSENLVDPPNWGATWQFDPYNAGLKDNYKIELKNNDKLPGYVRFTCKRNNVTQNQYLCFVDNGKYASFVDPVQYEKYHVIKMVNFVDLNNKELNEIQPNDYRFYIPISDYSRNLIPKVITSFTDDYVRCYSRNSKGLITDKNQFSSPYTDPKEGNDFNHLIDRDLGTFWHSDWHNNQPVEPGTHYFEVDLKTIKEGKITACMSRRAGNDNHITQLKLYARNDGGSYTFIQDLSFPFESQYETKSASFFLSQGYRYLKFVINQTNTNKGFGHMTEFQLYDDVTTNICNYYNQNSYAIAVDNPMATIGAYVWPTDISYDVDSTGYVYLNWNANVDDLDYELITKGDQFDILRTWSDGTGKYNEEEIGSVKYSYTQQNYTFRDDIHNINITGNLLYKIRRSETADTWQWKYCKEKGVDYITQLARIDSLKAFVDTQTDKAKITWKYVEGIWPKDMTVSIYNDLSYEGLNLLKTISTPKEAAKEYFIDKEFATCTKTQYSVIVDPGSKDFYYDIVQQKYIEPQAVNIGEPLLTTEMGVISNPRASKGYYNDHIDVNFDTRGVFEYYEIFRTSYYGDFDPNGNADVLKNELNLSTLSYTDKNVIPGVYYKYYIVGYVHCDGKLVSSDPISVVGFATSTGTVYGQICFNSGSAVPGVTVYAQTNDDNTLSGKSISLPGYQSSYLYVNKAFELDSAFAIQAYVQPKSDGTIFKLNEGTHLTYSGGKYVFNAGGQSVSADRNTDNGNVFEHVTAMFTKDSLKVYVNGELKNYVVGARYDSINANAIIGQGMKGLIDEVRLWNRTLSDEDIYRDYNRYLHGGEEGLLAYWRFNDGIDGEFYDLAHDKDNTYHQYDGVFVETDEDVADAIRYSDVVPTVAQLAFKGVTDAQGNYTISGLPYTGNGTMYSLYAEKGTHDFATGANASATTTRLVSQDSKNHQVDFTDKSAFTVSGYIFYDGGTVPSPGVMFKVDNNLQYDAEGNFITTDEDGHFSISVPVGIHKVQAYLANHTFVDEGRIINLDGSNRNYQENIENIHLYDNTRVRFVGRVAGGAVQESYPVGHSLSKNNLGENIVLTLKLKSETGKYKIASKDETVITKHQRVLQLENTKEDDLPQSSMTTSQSYIEIVADKNTGEFVADVYPLDYIISSINVSGHGNLLKTNENLDLRNKFVEQYSENTNVVTDSNDSIISSRLDSVMYNHSQLFIKRVSPTIELVQLSKSKRVLKYFGDNTSTVKNSDGSETDIEVYDEETGRYALGMPVFITNKKYYMQVHAYESYQYFDAKGDAMENKVDMVPLQDGLLTFQNDLSLYSYVDTVSVDSTGYAEYEFTCDEPDISDIGPAKNLSLKLDAAGATTLWNEGNPLKAIVLGSKEEGSRFITKGPDQLSFVLRDPPGSNSYSYIAKNFTTTHTSSYNWSLDNDGTESSEVSAGEDIGLISLAITPSGAGIGNVTKKETKESFTWGVLHTEGGGTGNSSSRTESYASDFETSSDPGDVGADADVFVGNSTNISYGPSVNIRLIPADAFSSASMKKVGQTEDGKYYVIRDKGLSFGILYDTQFTYTQKHIIDYLIPQLIEVRNSLLKPNTLTDEDAQILAQNTSEQIYRSNVPTTDEKFGTTGSYTIFYPKVRRNGKEVSVIESDTVNTLIESVARWEHYLAQNEKEKVLAKKLETDGNHSFSAGTSQSGTYEFTSADTNTSSFSFTIGTHYENDFDIDMGFFGSKIIVEESVTTSHNWDTEHTNEYSVLIGYVLSDPDEGDSYSVDICKYVPWDHLSDDEKAQIESSLQTNPNSSSQLDKLTKMAGSYVFRTIGGATSCPYEGEYVTKYYEPGQHVINAATLKIEDPVLVIEPATRIQVPADGKAEFKVKYANANNHRDVNYKLYVDPESNPYGARIMYGDASLTSKLVELTTHANKDSEDALKSDSLYITVERGVGFDFNNLKLVLESANDGNVSAEALFSVKFQRTAGSINIDSPADNWVLNTNSDFVNDQGEYELPVTITDFDINQTGFHHVALEYKPSTASEKEWITVCRFYSDDDLYNKDTGTKDRIPVDGKLVYNMNVQTLTDRKYDLRAACVAVLNGVEEIRYSPIVTGIKDTTRPTIYGSIKPEDNVLDYGEVVELIFNEEINSGIIGPNNFVVTGTQPASELRRDASIRFDGVNDCLVTEATTNLSGRDFTVESSIYIDSLNHDATFFSYGAPGKAFEVGMDTDKHLTIKCEGKSYTSEKVVDVQTGQWEHIAVIYTNNDRIATVYYNSQPVWTVNIERPTAKGTFTIGLGADGKNGFCGKMSELRIWNIACKPNILVENRNKSLRNNQIGLLSYYPMDEGFGTFVTDKARGANAIMCDAQWFINRSGYAAKLSADKTPGLEINIGSTPLTKDDDFTLEFWFRGAKGQKNVALFSNGQAESEPDAEDHITIGFNGNGNLHVKTSKTDHISDLSADNLLNDAWHHLAFIVDRSAGNAKIYVDGVFDSYFDSHDVYTLSSSFATFGCRTNIPNVEGHINKEMYSYDQCLNGSVDEIRLWNLAKNSTMIEEQFNKALAGNERSLLAYYPFETYVDNQGTQEMIFTMSDMSAEGAITKNIASGNATETKDTAPIQEAGAVKQLEVNWTTKSDRMTIERKSGSWNDFDQTMMTFKVYDIYDTNNNVIKSPIVFSLYIDQSPLKWEKKEVNLVVPSGEGGEFTVDIENLYGGNQNYTIENQPSWLGVSTASGQLASKDSKHIKFTIDRALNVGSYTETVYLVNGDGLARPLNINIKVKGEGPDWNVNPSNYAYSMNIIGQLKIDGELSSDGEDMIAAFSGDECVGVATNRYNASKGLYYTFLSVYSNASAGTEPLTFRVWDASTGKITIGKPSIGDIIFKSDDVKGSISEPVEFVNTDAISEKYELTSGWNWVSFNLELGADEASSVIANGMWSSGDEIKNARYVDSYSTSQNGWIGTLSNHGGLNNTELFKLKVKNGQTVVVEGKPVDVTKTSISVKQGWNYISYLPTTLMTLKDALASYDASAGDVIKSQTGFAQYDNNNGWVGNVDYLSPSKGYMLKRTASSSSSFKYPSYSSTSHSAQRRKTRSVMTEAEEGEHYYSSNMNVIATIEGIELQDNDELVASVRGERRSYTDRIAYNDQPLWFVTIEGEEVAPIIFTVERDGKPIASTRSVFDYHNDDIRGTLQTPTVINFTSLSDDVNVSPRLFKSQFTVSLDKPVINNLKVEVYSVTGQLVLHDKALNVQGAYSHTFDGSALTNGVYLVRVIVDGEPTIIRIVKH